MTERIDRKRHSDSYLQKELDLDIESEADFDQVVEKRYEELFGELKQSDLREYFFGTLVPQIKEIYGHSYLKAARRILRIIENGSNLPKDQVAEYFQNRAVHADEVSFARLPQERREKFHADIVQAILNAIIELHKRYGESTRLVDAVLVYGSFAEGSYTFDSDIDVIYITSGQKSDQADGEFVDAAAEMTRLLRIKTGKQIDDFFGPYDISESDEIQKHVREDGILSDECTVISPNADLKAQLESLLHA